MKYLVTGGCGFIGSNLVESLVNDGNDVVVVDDISTGSVKNLKKSKHVTFIREDVETMFCNSAFRENRNSFDCVYHLGIPSSSPIYRASRKTVATAVSDFIDMMEFVKNHELKMVYASSSSVYNGNIPPFNEYMPIFPTDYYTEARYAMERIAEVYRQFYNTNTIGLRLFSVYGNNERSKGTYANLVSQMVWAKEADEPFDIYGDGTSTRDLVNVKDVVRGFRIAETYSNNKHSIFNIGTGITHTMNEIAELIGVKVKYVDNPLVNYVSHTCADITRAKCDLGFVAQVKIEDYIDAEL